MSYCCHVTPHCLRTNPRVSYIHWVYHWRSYVMVNHFSDENRDIYIYIYIYIYILLIILMGFEIENKARKIEVVHQQAWELIWFTPIIESPVAVSGRRWLLGSWQHCQKEAGAKVWCRTAQLTTFCLWGNVAFCSPVAAASARPAKLR